jgi:protein phosphatase 1 regulatory subunit 16A
MPYDICEDEAALDYIEGEMARRGVTQELIDETRASTELQMLRDLNQMAADGRDLEVYDHQGATPVRGVKILWMDICYSLTPKYRPVC